MAGKSRAKGGRAVPRKPKRTGSTKRARKTDVAAVPDLLDMNQAIAFLKTSRPTFYRWLRAGKVKGMKVGRQWRFRFDDLQRFLSGEAPRIELRADLGPLVKALRERVEKAGGKDLSPSDADDLTRAVDLMITLAVAMKASDIHVEPHVTEDGGKRVGVLRYRVHGVLHALAEFDIRLLPRIIEQWKRMAACNVRETARLQDGRIILDVGDEQVGLRVCFLPAALGETVAVRILNRDVNAMLDLGRINYATEDKARLLRALDKPSGLIVVSGPAGCGKTTVLYSCIKHLAGSERKTMTVEEPVEVLLPWTVQIQAGPQERVSRPAALRSILRSDPDVIMIGELRDKETLDLAIECALTGHLVISTMHVRTAPATLTRMIDMGADAFSLSEATRLIVAQRLVRVLCPKCARAGKPPESRLSRAGELARAGGLDWDKLGRDFRTPIGCAKCHETGYSGRNVIAEVLAVTDELRTALGHGASLDELQAIAVREGMTTLAADGIRRAAEGQTSLEEVMRVVGNG